MIEYIGYKALFVNFCPRSLVEVFRKQEIMNWDFIQNTYSTLLRHGTPQEPVTGVFSVDTEEGEGRWEDLRKRVIEHVSLCCFTCCRAAHCDLCLCFCSVLEYSSYCSVLY